MSAAVLVEMRVVLRESSWVDEMALEMAVKKADLKDLSWAEL